MKYEGDGCQPGQLFLNAKCTQPLRADLSVAADPGRYSKCGEIQEMHGFADTASPFLMCVLSDREVAVAETSELTDVNLRSFPWN